MRLRTLFSSHFLFSVSLFLFFLALPFQKRLFLGQSSFIPTSISFFEYGSFWLYLSDFFVLFLFISFCFRFCSLSLFIDKLSSLWHSIYSFFSKLFHLALAIVSRETIGFSFSPFLKLFHVKQFLFLFLGVSLVLNVLLSSSSSWSFYIVSRETIGFLVFIILVFSAKRYYRLTLLSIVFSGLIQGIISIVQFFTQRPIGLYWIGEISEIFSTTPGVAKFLYGNSLLIRTYGTFPHPNILAAFLLLSFLVFITIVSRETIALPIFKKLFYVKQFFVLLILFLFIFSIFLTFSRSVILLFFIINLYFFFSIFVFKLFHVKQFKLVILQTFFLTLFVVAMLFPLLYSRFFPSIVSRETIEFSRLFYWNYYQSLLSSVPFFGLGLGMSTPYFLVNTPSAPVWSFQPPHNYFLLLFIELGYPVLLVFAFLFLKILRFLVSIVSRETIEITLFIIFIIFLSFFDHYFATSEQGRLILWTTLALITSFRTLVHRF